MRQPRLHIPGRRINPFTTSTRNLNRPKLVLPARQIVAENADLTYCASLAKKHTHELGFVPYEGYVYAWEHHRIRVQRLNGEPCGFLLHCPIRRGKTLRIVQTVIQVDARRIASATEMVANLILDAQELDVPQIRLGCAADLEANAFWLACGFDLVKVEWHNNVRSRPINYYQLELTPKSQLILF